MKKSARKKTKKLSRAVRKPRSRSVRARFHERDITQLMLRDHKVLKQFIRTLKKEDASTAALREAFEALAPALEAHAKPEQKTLYAFLMGMEKGEELRPEGFEGLTEHEIADLLVREIQGTADEDQWRARVKVLGELVEHHIEEEEENLIPDLRKEIGEEERIQIGEDYLRLRSQFAGEAQKAA